MVKELIPIVLSCVVSGWQLAGKHAFIECDNSSVVAAVSKQYTKEQAAMHLLRTLCFSVAHFDIDFKCKHIAVLLPEWSSYSHTKMLFNWTKMLYTIL